MILIILIIFLTFVMVVDLTQYSPIDNENYNKISDKLAKSNKTCGGLGVRILPVKIKAIFCLIKLQKNCNCRLKEASIRVIKHVLRIKIGSLACTKFLPHISDKPRIERIAENRIRYRFDSYSNSIHSHVDPLESSLYSLVLEIVILKGYIYHLSRLLKKGNICEYSLSYIDNAINYFRNGVREKPVYRLKLSLSTLLIGLIITIIMLSIINCLIKGYLILPAVIVIVALWCRLFSNVAKYSYLVLNIKDLSSSYPILSVGDYSVVCDYNGRLNLYINGELVLISPNINLLYSNEMVDGECLHWKLLEFDEFSATYCYKESIKYVNVNNGKLLVNYKGISGNLHVLFTLNKKFKTDKRISLFGGRLDYIGDYVRIAADIVDGESTICIGDRSISCIGYNESKMLYPYSLYSLGYMLKLLKRRVESTNTSGDLEPLYAFAILADIKTNKVTVQRGNNYIRVIYHNDSGEIIIEKIKNIHNDTYVIINNGPEDSIILNAIYPYNFRFTGEYLSMYKYNDEIASARIANCSLKGNRIMISLNMAERIILFDREVVKEKIYLFDTPLLTKSPNTLLDEYLSYNIWDEITVSRDLVGIGCMMRIFVGKRYDIFIRNTLSFIKDPNIYVRIAYIDSVLEYMKSYGNGVLNLKYQGCSLKKVIEEALNVMYEECYHEIANKVTTIMMKWVDEEDEYDRKIAILDKCENLRKRFLSSMREEKTLSAHLDEIDYRLYESMIDRADRLKYYITEYFGLRIINGILFIKNTQVDKDTVLNINIEGETYSIFYIKGEKECVRIDDIEVNNVGFLLGKGGNHNIEVRYCAKSAIN